MSKKSTRATKQKLTKNSVEKPKSRIVFPENRGEWLELCIKYTDRAMSGPHGLKTLQGQKDRLEKELQEWRKNESKRVR